MNTYICIAALLLCALPQGAFAQKLWRDAVFGMSPSQVSRAYPESTPSTSTSGFDDRQQHMKSIVHDEPVPTTVHFYFRDQVLYRVDLVLKPGATYEDTMPAYETALQQIKAQHAPKGLTTTQRPFEWSAADRAKAAKWFMDRMDQRTREAKDEWKGLDGTEVRVQMQEFARGDIVDINVSMNSESLWNQLQSEAAERKRQARLAQITAKKTAEERRYGDFLNGFSGRSINALAAVLGAPTGMTKMPGNDVIYVWETQAGEGLSCRTSVFTRNKGLIYNWQWSGNSCRRTQ